jgi:hypothetical protein
MSRGWLLALLLLAKSSAAAPLSLLAEAAWDGALKAGRGTEVILHLQAEQNARVTIRLPNHAPQLQLQVELQAFRPLRLPVAVRPDPTVPLRVEARTDDGLMASTELRFSIVPAHTRLIATALALPTIQADDQVRLAHPAPGQLPHTPAGYATLDALVLDGDSLAALDAPQLASLHQYLRRCGTLVLVASEAAARAPLRQIAGCGGRQLHAADHPAAAGARLQGHHAAALPDAPRLQELLPAGSHAGWRPLVWFFVLYGLALLLLARGSHARLLVIPLLGGTLAWLAWTQDDAERQLASWSEIKSGDHSLRYAALLHIRGNGKGTSHTPLPHDLGLPEPQVQGDASELRLASDGSRGNSLVVPNRLLVQHRYYSQGSLPWSAPLRLRLGAQGPEVENPGTHPSTPALLGWNGRRSPVPALQPGERWSPPPQDTPWQTARAEEQLLRLRTQGGTAALLLPHRLLPAEAAHDIEERGWLLITQG